MIKKTSAKLALAIVLFGLVITIVPANTSAETELNVLPATIEYGEVVYFNASFDEKPDNVTFVYCSDSICYLPKLMAYNGTSEGKYYYYMALNTSTMQATSNFGVRLEAKTGGATAYYPSEHDYYNYDFNDVAGEPEYSWVFAILIVLILAGIVFYNKMYCSGSPDPDVCVMPEKEREEERKEKFLGKEEE